MASIEKWFEEKDYDTGISLLSTYSKNRILIQNLKRRRNPEKLTYELKKIAALEGNPVLLPEKDMPPKLVLLSKESEQQKEEEEVPEKLKIVRVGRTVNIDELPQELQKLLRENYDNYKMIRSLHEKLKLMENTTPEDRRPLTEKIAGLDDRIRRNWEIIDSWNPDVEPVKKTVDFKRISANRKFISSNLKKLTEVNDPAKSYKIIAEIIIRYNELKEAGESVSAETAEALVKIGVTL